MNLVTYNLRAGGAGRSHWTRVLDAFQPDLFLVQETAHPEEHLPPMLYPDAARKCAWTRAEGRRWGSAVYAVQGDVQLLELSDFRGLVAGAEITGGEWPDASRGPLKVFSIHAPQRPNYHRAVNQILDRIAESVGNSEVVIGGDFNLTSRHSTSPNPPASRATTSPFTVGLKTSSA